MPALAAALLAAAALAALADLLSSKGDRRILVQGFSGTAFVVLGIWLALRWPRAGAGEILAWAAFGCLAVHLGCLAKMGLRSLAPFLLPVAAACALTAQLAGDQPWGRAGDGPLPFWTRIHGMAALAGLSAFALAFASGGLYLIQDFRLRRDPTQASRLPSLGILDRLNLIGLVLALPAWTLAVLAGLLGGGRSGMGTRLAWISATAWVLLAVAATARLTASARGRKVAILSVAAFALALAALFEGHR